jgi:predicted nuclease with TOPRIM domain
VASLNEKLRKLVEKKATVESRWMQLEEEVEGIRAENA